MRCVFDRKLKVLTQLEIVKVCNGSKGFPAHTPVPSPLQCERGCKKNPNPIISTLVVLLMSQSQLQHFFCTYILIFLDIHSNRSHIGGEGGGAVKGCPPPCEIRLKC